MNRNNCKNYAQINIQFDELQTIEHLKPLSVAVAVSKKERKIIGFQVSSMPATGHLAKISRKKYGKRPDMKKGMRQLFDYLSRQLSTDIRISKYKGVVKKSISATYTQYLGKKGFAGHKKDRSVCASEYKPYENIMLYY